MFKNNTQWSTTELLEKKADIDKKVKSKDKKEDDKLPMKPAPEDSNNRKTYKENIKKSESEVLDDIKDRLVKARDELEKASLNHMMHQAVKSDTCEEIAEDKIKEHEKEKHSAKGHKKEHEKIKLNKGGEKITREQVLKEAQNLLKGFQANGVRQATDQELFGHLAVSEEKVKEAHQRWEGTFNDFFKEANKPIDNKVQDWGTGKMIDWESLTEEEIAARNLAASGDGFED